jgi:hypothetical protein
MTNNAAQGQGAAKTSHILTIIVDLSHESLKSGGLPAALKLAKIVQGFTRFAVNAVDSAVVTDKDYKPVAVWLITEGPAEENSGIFREMVEAATESGVGTDRNTGETISADMIKKG